MWIIIMDMAHAKAKWPRHLWLTCGSPLETIGPMQRVKSPYEAKTSYYLPLPLPLPLQLQLQLPNINTESLQYTTRNLHNTDTSVR